MSGSVVKLTVTLSNGVSAEFAANLQPEGDNYIASLDCPALQVKAASALAALKKLANALQTEGL